MKRTCIAAAVVATALVWGPEFHAQTDTQKELPDGRFIATLAAGAHGDHEWSGLAYFQSAAVILCLEGGRPGIVVNINFAALYGSEAGGEYAVSVSSGNPQDSGIIFENRRARDGSGGGRLTVTARSGELFAGTLTASVLVRASYRTPLKDADSGTLTARFRARPRPALHRSC